MNGEVWGVAPMVGLFFGWLCDGCRFPVTGSVTTTEALMTQASGEGVSEKSAQQFLERMQGTHEVVESEPGVYRHSEITGEDFKVFDLTSLLPGTGFALHISKVAE